MSKSNTETGGQLPLEAPAPEKKKRVRPSRAKKNLPAKSQAVVQNPAPSPIMTGPEAEAVAFMALLERATTEPLVDVGKMEKLLNMKKDVMHEQKQAAFNRDYLSAKLEMPRVRKDGSVEYAEDKNKPDGPKKKAFNYAKYEDIDKAIRPIEQKYGFARIFTTKPRVGDGGGCVVHCQLLHRDGFFKEAEIAVALDASGGKNNIQAMGSSFSYGKRYTTEMLWDIVKEGADDDGNAAFAAAPIDDAQFTAMQAIIDEWKIDTAKFCEHLGVESLRAIPNKMYPKAMNDLKANAEARKKKAAEKAQKEGQTA